MTASIFQKAVDFVLTEEGGLHDDPNDPGGLTNFGIALARHPELTADQLRALTRDQAVDIYRHQYWDEVRGDDLPDPVSFVALDAAVNQGPARAAHYLQLSCGVQPDGVLGPLTLTALEALAPKTFLSRFCSERIVGYAQDPGWASYAHGWTARAVSAALEALS